MDAAKTTRLTVAAVTILAILTGLTACDSTTWTEPRETPSVTNFDCEPISTAGNTGLRECEITLKDKRQVTCLLLADSWKSGLTCDWEHTDGSDDQ